MIIDCVWGDIWIWFMTKKDFFLVISLLLHYEAQRLPYNHNHERRMIMIKIELTK